MKALGIVASTLALLVVTMVLHAWVASVLWAWFVRPVFAGAPSISYAQAIGLVLLLNFLRADTASTRDDGTKSGSELFFEAAVRATAAPLLTLFIAWLVRLVVQ